MLNNKITTTTKDKIIKKNQFRNNNKNDKKMKNKR